MRFFSCSQPTDEEGVPSNRLVNIYNLCAQISFIFHPFYIAQHSFFESLLPCACDAYANYLGSHYAVVLDMCD